MLLGKFEPSKLLKRMAVKGETFHGRFAPGRHIAA